VSAFSESYDFGASVAISETFTHIVVGAPNSTVNAVYDQGTVFIFSPATQGPNFRCVLSMFIYFLLKRKEILIMYFFFFSI